MTVIQRECKITLSKLRFFWPPGAMLMNSHCIMSKNIGIVFRRSSVKKLKHLITDHLL